MSVSLVKCQKCPNCGELPGFIFRPNNQWKWPSDCSFCAISPFVRDRGAPDTSQSTMIEWFNGHVERHFRLQKEREEKDREIARAIGMSLEAYREYRWWINNPRHGLSDRSKGSEGEK